MVPILESHYWTDFNRPQSRYCIQYWQSQLYQYCCSAYTQKRVEGNPDSYATKAKGHKHRQLCTGLQFRSCREMDRELPNMLQGCLCLPQDMKGMCIRESHDCWICIVVYDGQITSKENFILLSLNCMSINATGHEFQGQHHLMMKSPVTTADN